jgi:multimeric flavodoxin WrbA
MKILGISGSLRKKGNTSILIKRALDVCKDNGAYEVEFLSLADFEIKYCDDCNHCIEENKFRCPIDDDVPKILEKMIQADALIIASPVYFSSISGKLKVLFDRTLPLRRNKCKLGGKIGGAIAVGGSRNGGQEFTIREIHNWMLLQEMIIISDKKTAHFGGICVGRKEGDVLKDEIGLKTVENLALKVIETLNRLNRLKI